MIRISKLADYGTVIMAFLAKSPDRAFSAKEVAKATHIALPTVSKLLKQLAKSSLIFSKQGVKGGYYLGRASEEISLADIINALEGGVALTECSQGHGRCVVEKNCAIRKHFRGVSAVVNETLNKIFLSEMLG
jgi:FeS assembly SUF system regulator